MSTMKHTILLYNVAYLMRRDENEDGPGDCSDGGQTVK
jgi:hypothetical protein